MLELACFTASSAISAARAGASRIELCASYSLGGVTPLPSTLHSIHAETTIPIYIMIRPRGGNFTYSSPEFEAMKRSIQTFKASNAVDGFVFGILTEDARVDEVRNRELVLLAAPLPCTFHRAVDEVVDLVGAVEAVVACGFRSVLTSGGEGSAVEGVQRAAELQRRFGERVSLILGGGVRSSNVVGLKEETRVEWVHSAAITGSGEEVDEVEVRRMVALLQDV